VHEDPASLQDNVLEDTPLELLLQTKTKSKYKIAQNEEETEPKTL